MLNNKKTIKGYWVKADSLYSLLDGLYRDAKARKGNINIIGDATKEKLEGIMMATSAVVDYLKDKVYHGSLRIR
jgi:hypothetical protein